MFRRYLRRFVPAKLRVAVRHHRETKRVQRAIRDDSATVSPPRPHLLPGQLFISLTSFPARFGTLHLALESLLRQSVRPDGLLLWIAHGDIDQLPPEVTDLTRHGLVIRACDDIRSYKKLIFALEAHPDAFIVTADDDLYYPPLWLETLVEAHVAAEPAILCHRAHRVRHNPDGSIAPYGSWEEDVQDERSRAPSSDLLPTTGAGALFYPGCFSSDVLDRVLFQELAPDADDLWFYWMARQAGTQHRKVGGPFRLLYLPASQSISLFASNEGEGNDRQIRALQEALGPPQPRLAESRT